MLVLVSGVVSCFNYGWRKTTAHFSSTQLDSFVPGHTSRSTIEQVAAQIESKDVTVWGYTDRLYPYAILAGGRIIVYSWSEWGLNTDYRVYFYFDKNNVLKEKKEIRSGWFTTVHERASQSFLGRWYAEIEDESIPD
jgi:hypothetical protein